MGTQLTCQKGTVPQFSAHAYCGQTAVCIGIPLATEVDLNLGNTVLNGDPVTLKGTHPQFSANVHCGQMAAWTMMPLDVQVGLGPGDFVFDGNPAPSPEKRQSFQPNFWPMSIVAKQLDASRHHLVRK